MNHPGPEELVDVLDDAASPATREHVASCASCRERVEELRAAMRLAAKADVPEPSPLFWDHLSARVRERIAEEPVSSARHAGLRWWVALPIALAFAVLLLFVARMSVLQLRPAVERSRTAGGQLPLVAIDEDSWAVLASMSEDLTFDEVADAVAVSPGAAERAAMQLTPREQQELVRLLRNEVGTTP